MRLRLCLVLVTAVLVGAVSVQAAVIGIFRDAGATDCGIPEQAFTPGDLYVVAAVTPEACDGISGAEFRIEGFPTTWFVIPSPDPRIPEGPGDPMGDGARIAFAQCQRSDTGLVLLFHIQFLPTTTVVNQTLSVLPHRTPRPQFDCPLVTLCDAPVFTALCVTGAPAQINGIGLCCPLEGGCNFPTCPPLAVAPTGWSQVKRLYE